MVCVGGLLRFSLVIHKLEYNTRIGHTSVIIIDNPFCIWVTIQSQFKIDRITTELMATIFGSYYFCSCFIFNHMILILFRILEASVINQEWRCIYQLWRRSWIIMGAAENVNMTPYHIIAKLLFSLLIRQLWILRCTKVTDTYIITGWPQT